MTAMRMKRCLLILAAAALLGFGAPGCVITGSAAQNTVVTGGSAPVAKEPLLAIDDAPFADDKYLYTGDAGDSVVTMYLTVRRGSAAENTDHSWAEINSYSSYRYAEMGVEKYQVEGLLQIGDENGLVAGELGFGLKIPNATVQIRGATTSRMPQKSFKIELKKDNGEWRGQRTIALNKHVFDALRFRNKLVYDVMKDIPDMISIRTQFVHLYVKDETGRAGKGFADYGLFTQVEQPNMRFLQNHGLDSNGQLYKMNFFEYYRYPDEIRLKTDPQYDVNKFETRLEIKGSDDHSKLIAMLDDVNDYSKPIEEVFEKYFDSDNYFTWLAFNILIGNIDTQSRNNYLYSPLNGNKWYYIAWDCDSALTRYEYGLTDRESIGYEYGVSNYWGDVIFNRLMRLPKYRAMLDEKIEAVRKIVTAQKVNALARAYAPVVERYLFSMPDVMHSEYSKAEYEAMADTFANELDLNYRLYRQSLGAPMPFYLDVPAYRGNRLNFKWDPAFDFQGGDIQYAFELATDCEMEDIIAKADRLDFPETSTDALRPGKYFYRVRATNEAGNTQCAMTYYVFDSVKHYGVQCFYVLRDGTIALEGAHE